MAISEDIVNSTSLPEQEPRQPSPVSEQAARTDPPATPDRTERPPAPTPSSLLAATPPVPIPTVQVSDAVVASMLAAPPANLLPRESSIEAVVTDFLKNMTFNGYPTNFQNGNLDVQVPIESLVLDGAPFSLTPPTAPSSIPSAPVPASEPAPAPASPEVPTPATPGTPETPPPTPPPPTTPDSGDGPKASKPGEAGFFYGQEHNRRSGESYVDQVGREKREASGQPESEPEPDFAYGREENRRKGESYVDQVSRERKGDTASPPPGAASSTEGVFTEDRPEEERAAESEKKNYVGDRRMGDYGKKENRREDESHGDQVTREHREDREERKSQRQERKEDEDRFDPMSKRRQEGESRKEHKERKELILGFDQQAQEALRNGDTTLLGKGYVPVLFSRADDKRKVLLRLDVTHSAVIEGAQSNERQGTLPSEDAYYLGGGGGDSGFHPFQVRLETDDEGAPLYRVELNSNLYTGLANYNKQNITGLNFPSTPSEGFLSLFGVVSNGVVTSASIQGPEAVPSDRIDFVSSQQTSFNYLIAYLFKAGDSWKVRQLCFQDLTLIDICVNGVPCRYPFAV